MLSFLCVVGRHLIGCLYGSSAVWVDAWDAAAGAEVASGRGRTRLSLCRPWCLQVGCCHRSGRKKKDSTSLCFPVPVWNETYLSRPWSSAAQPVAQPGRQRHTGV